MARDEQLIRAALDAAADALQSIVDNWDCGHPESRLCNCAPLVEQWVSAADEVRAIDVDEVLAKVPPAPDAVARLVEAANQARLALAGYVSAQSAIDKLDEVLAAMETDHD